MLSHSFKDQFLAAATKKYTDLEYHDIFYLIQRAGLATILFLIWIFIYKFDTDDYVTKFKTCLCVRENLQDQFNHDIYAAMLAVKIFHILMTVAAVFNLKIFQ